MIALDGWISCFERMPLEAVTRPRGILCYSMKGKSPSIIFMLLIECVP